MRLWNVSPARRRTGRRLACATPAAVTMFSAPGPIEEVAAISTPARRLREADRGERHPLLVLSAEGEELLPRLVQRVSQAEHVPVAEDREHAGDERRLLAVEHSALCYEVADDRLCRRQPDGLHAAPRPCA